MDKIFGFVALRRPSQEAPRSLTLADSSDFQRQLRAAASGPNPLGEVTRAARTFADAGRMLTDVDAAYRGRAFLEFYERWAGRSREELDDIQGEARGLVGQSQPADWAADATRARDTVLAAYLLETDARAATAVKLLRAYTVAETAFAGAGPPADLDALLHAPLLLPDYLLELRDRPLQEAPAQPSPDEIATALLAQFKSARERHASLTQALAEIGRHDEDELVLDELGERRPLTSLYQPAARPAERLHLHKPPEPEKKPAAPPVSAGSSLLRRAAARTNVTLSDTAVRLLSKPARNALNALGLDPAVASVQEMQRRVAAAHEDATQELRGLALELSRLIS